MSLQEKKKRGRPPLNQTIFSDEKISTPDESKENSDNELKELKNEFNEAKFDSEKKESKYKKNQRIEAEKEKLKRESISGFGSIGLSILIDRMDNPQPLSEIEKRNFDLAFDNLADKYFAKLGQWQEESAFVVVLAFILIPRLNLGKKEEKKVDSENKND